MPFRSYAPFPGSARRAPRAAKFSGAPNPQEIVSVTIYLDRKSPVEHAGQPMITHQNRAAFSDAHGADPAHIDLVKEFANEHGLTIVNSSVIKRQVILRGTVLTMSNAFQVELNCYESELDGKSFRGRTGTISLPEELHGAVVAILGLDNRPQARAHIRRKKKKKPVVQPTTFTPPQIAQIYGFPTGVNGAGQTIGIIELGGGYTPSDLTTYFGNLGITQPNITTVSVDGGTNTPGGAADGEVELDIEVAGSIAPGANIAVYFAPNTDQGFIDAITDAVHDTARSVSVISISWGGPEDSWTAQSQTAMNAALQDAAALGVTVTIASGDNGSTDGEAGGALHVDFPASSPYALACGGTTLAGSGSSITSEVVWNETASNEGATGGGISAVFALPSYQQNAGVPALPTNQFVGRGVPDVAGNADPTTGYDILVDGSSEVVGGTSAVAPLWAALIALLNQKLGKNLGFVNPTLYSLGSAVFNDITSGNNDDGGLGYYSAGPGWDACTGLGSPNGAALLSALSSSTT